MFIADNNKLHQMELTFPHSPASSMRRLGPKIFKRRIDNLSTSKSNVLHFLALFRAWKGWAQFKRSTTHGRWITRVMSWNLHFCYFCFKIMNSANVRRKIFWFMAQHNSALKLLIFNVKRRRKVTWSSREAKRRCCNNKMTKFEINQHFFWSCIK